MNKLRQQIEIAHAEYAAMRYPGDLAAIVLGRAVTASRDWWTSFGLSGLAAALAVWLWWTPPEFIPWDRLAWSGTSSAPVWSPPQFPSATIPRAAHIVPEVPALSFPAAAPPRSRGPA